MKRGHGENDGGAADDCVWRTFKYLRTLHRPTVLSAETAVFRVGERAAATFVYIHICTYVRACVCVYLTCTRNSHRHARSCALLPTLCSRLSLLFCLIAREKGGDAERSR